MAAAADDPDFNAHGSRERPVRRGARQIPPSRTPIRSGVLDLLMAFIAHGRMVLRPIF
jgi:hypothetical protein